MKQYFLQGLVVAGALVALPAFAQKAKSADKDKQVQTIVITRDGNIEEKTVIEIKGNEVLVNGKEADKNPDVNVNVTTVKRGGHVSINGIGGRNTWVYNDDDGPNFFTEDDHRAMLGVVTELVDKGAEIGSVTKGSAAEKAGLKKGDIILSIDNVPIKEDGDVSKAIRTHKPGDKVKVTFLRDGKEQSVTPELSTWKGLNTFNLRVPSFHMEVPSPPMPPGAGAYYFRSSDRPRLGVSIQDTEDGKGVKVTDVDEETPAAKAGIRENDIITKVDDQAVDGTDDLRRITQRARQGSSFTFTILRGGKEQKVDVKYPRELKSANL